jgi:hypothetical protein
LGKKDWFRTVEKRGRGVKKSLSEMRGLERVKSSLEQIGTFGMFIPEPAKKAGLSGTWLLMTFARAE